VKTSFYTVADSDFAIGAIALLNALRILGHSEEMVVLDCGLSDSQRSLLEPHATLVDGPPGRFPALAKWHATLAEPADVMVVFDADVFPVRSLQPLIDLAARGHVVVFRDRVSRFFPEWSTELRLGELKRRPSANAGFVALPREPGIALVRRMDALMDRVDVDRTLFVYSDDYRDDYPYLCGDQDVMNAVFCSSAIEDDELVVLGAELMSSARAWGGFDGLEVVDARTLECRLPNGESPYVLHHWGPKPWLEPVPKTPFTVLLSRLLFADDVRIRIDPADVPLLTPRWSTAPA
jgi:hypothetical protein